MDTFEVTEEHIKLLKNAYTSWDSCENGAPEIDCKYPYGDRDLVKSISKILNWPAQWEGTKEYNDLCDRAWKIHKEMETVLQILLLHADEGLKPGVFQRENAWSGPWKRQK